MNLLSIASVVHESKDHINGAYHVGERMMHVVWGNLKERDHSAVISLNVKMI
jgi:hypothetical protein